MNINAIVPLMDSFIERNARERARSLLDEGSFRELLDPFDRFESPHLAKLNIVPQSDDGVVVARGTLSGESAVVLSIDGTFQGGGIGEVSGAKIAAGLELALRDCRKGRLTRPILIMNTGGVRLQEGNYGLLAIAEIGAAIVALREYVPVVGVIPGMIGCFGGMSICAGLCSYLVMTKQGRLQLNGPEVIELEAGLAEFNASDRRMIWSIAGGQQRTHLGMADYLTDDSLEAIHSAVSDAFIRGIPATYRSRDFESWGKFARIDPSARVDGPAWRSLWESESGSVLNVPIDRLDQARNPSGGHSRGRTWYELLSGKTESVTGSVTDHVPSVLCADTMLDEELIRYISVAANLNNRFPRARQGEVGIDEGWTLARYVHDTIQADSDRNRKRAIVAIVDVLGQAYGYMEELLGIHQSCAAAVDAYASARLAGHPVIALIVGNAISGAFLAHGLQANCILALDDPDIQVQVMSKKSAARITRRTIADLEEAARIVPAAGYDVKSFASLGILDHLIGGVCADRPSSNDLATVRKAIASAIHGARAGSKELNGRLTSKEAATSRSASIYVRERISARWD